MSRNAEIALTALAIAAYLLWGVHYAGVDLWWDEISSLSEYALVDLKSTLTTYPDRDFAVAPRDAEALLDAASIDPSRRAETLTIAEWAALARAAGAGSAR